MRRRSCLPLFPGAPQNIAPPAIVRLAQLTPAAQQNVTQPILPLLSRHARRLNLTNARVDQGDCVPPVLERRSGLPRSLQRAAQERQPFQIEARDLLRRRFSLGAAQVAQPRIPITGLPDCTRVTMTLDKGVP